MNPSAPTRVVQGQLLHDPSRAPEPGWVRLEGDTIAELGFGDRTPGANGPLLGSPSLLVCPAFTDAHFHVPQIQSIGCDGMLLLEWLDRIVYPAEGWWGRGGATPATRAAIRAMIRAGTAGFAGYLTSHAQGSAEAIDLLGRTPLRFHVGRVVMDRHAPADLTREDVERARMRPPPSVLMPVRSSAPRQHISANPRFAIACSDELLAEVGWECKRPERSHAFIQTHLAETMDECAMVQTLFPWAEHYAGVYERFGLLTERTILAHGLHLRREEWELIAHRRCILATCPGANVFLKAGLFDLDSARDFNVRLALGSDVAAGPDVAMPRVARQYIEVAKLRALCGAGLHVPTPAEAWTLITQGNAEALGWNDCGRLAPGCVADLLLLRVPDLWRDEHLIGRLIYNWSEDLIEHRVFAGRVVGPDTITTSLGA